MKVKIIKDPTGKYGLSYEVGEVVNLPDQQANDLIEDSFAVKTNEPVRHNYEGFVFGFEKETAESKKQKEKR